MFSYASREDFFRVISLFLRSNQSWTCSFFGGLAPAAAVGITVTYDDIDAVR